jgi:uncharacterized protein
MLASRVAWILPVLFGCATAATSDSSFGGAGSSGPSVGGGPGTGGAGASAGAPSSGGAPEGGASPGAGGAGASGAAGAGGSTSSSPGPGVLLFSEYVEGSGNNKAVEIANVGGASISTSGCLIARYQNGGSTPLSPDLPLDAVTLGPGEVFVVCNNSFSQPSFCDQLSSGLSHSGNDVVALDCGGLLDVIGRIGEDAVWGTSPAVTQDATLRRTCSVQSGDPNGADAFEPAEEWSGFPADTFSGLGQHPCP